MNTPSINPDLLKRLAAKKANNGTYRPPFATSYSSRWGGEPWKLDKYTNTHTYGRFHEDPEVPFLRVGLAHEIVRLRHTGWYVDQHQDETTKGIVFRLVGKRGWIAATTDPWNCDKDGHGPVIVEVRPNGQPYIYDSPEEAARNADKFAERYSEVCREDDEKQSAIQDKEGAIEESEKAIETYREKVRELVEAIRDSKVGEALCAILRGQVAELRRKSHCSFRRLTEAKKELAELNA